MMEWIACTTDASSTSDLLGSREGHCAALLRLSPSSSSASSCPPEDYIVVVGGYMDGELTATPIAAPAHRLPHLAWRATDVCENGRLHRHHADPDDAESTCDAATEAPTVVECDGASLTRVRADKAILFGGLDAAMDRCNTTYQLQLQHQSSLSFSSSSKCVWCCVLTTLNVTGEVPAPRSRHGATSDYDPANLLSGSANVVTHDGGCGAVCEPTGTEEGGRLYIFAGETDTEEQTNELYVFDTITAVWRRVHATPPSLRPAPRFNALVAPFLTAEVFVVYGGAYFTADGLASRGDVWLFDTTRQSWSPLAAPTHAAWPRSNGHVGGRLPGGPCGREVVFVGGKDVATGCDAVRRVCLMDSPAGSLTATAKRVRLEVCVADAAGEVPHWRYTAAAVETRAGLLLLAGQCRHPQPVSAYLLRPRGGAV